MKKIQILALATLLSCFNNAFSIKSELETETTSHDFDSCASSNCLDCQKQFAPANISLRELSSRASRLASDVDWDLNIGLVSDVAIEIGKKAREHCNRVVPHGSDKEMRAEFVACKRYRRALRKHQDYLEKENEETSRRNRERLDKEKQEKEEKKKKLNDALYFFCWS